jgi:hypothetical protein
MYLLHYAPKLFAVLCNPSPKMTAAQQTKKRSFETTHQGHSENNYSGVKPRKYQQMYVVFTH